MANSWTIALGVLGAVGGLTLLRAAYTALDFLAFHIITPRQPLKAYKHPGPELTWALITGASAGIGLGVAQELVRQGFGVILLGHLADELEASAAELRSMGPGTGPAPVDTVVMDARTATADEMAALARRLSSRRVTILVNNVGSIPIALPAFRGVGTLSTADVDAVINMNARFMARLTALMLPLLSRRDEGVGEKEQQKNRRALILNTSSIGMVGLPWIVMYSATKAFNWAFSRGLSRELEADPATRHVDCLCVVPGDVLSQGNSVNVPSNAPTWDYFGRCVVRKADGALARGRRDMRPYWLHDVQVGLMNALPESMRTSALQDMMGKKRDAFNEVWEKSR